MSSLKSSRSIPPASVIHKHLATRQFRRASVSKPMTTIDLPPDASATTLPISIFCSVIVASLATPYRATQRMGSVALVLDPASNK
jgi:hypothetical protein